VTRYILRRLLLPVILLAAAVSPVAHGQKAITEAQAKAAFLFNFARYVEWPDRAFASREAPLVFCTVGRDGLGSALAALESKQVQGRPIRLRRGITTDDVKGCHVAFVGDPEERRVAPTLRAFAGLPILTVGDTEGFIDAGGAIGLVSGEDRLQFEVNRAALEQAQLRASSNLLKLARNLNESKPR
jgi:hypothetical protein